MTPRISNGISLLAGTILPLAFAPFHFYPIALFSPFVLLYLLRNVSSSQAWFLGWLFGFGFFGVGASWVFVSIHQYGHASLFLSFILTALFVSVLALFIAIQSWVWVRFFRGRRGAILLSFPALWVLFEWIRGWILTGFPWLYLGYSQVDSPLSGYLPVIGVLGVSWLVVLSSSLGFKIFFSFHRWVQRGTALVLLFLIWFLAFQFQSIEWVDTQKTIQVSLVQGNVPQEQKWLADQKIPIIKKYLKLTEPYWTSDLILWPENAIPWFLHEVEDFTAVLNREAHRHGSVLIVGIPIQEKESERYFNGAIVVGEGGGSYLKHHLVPFGEYVPFEMWLRGLIEFFDLPMSDFSEGRVNQAPLMVDSRKLGMTVCYEIAYGQYVAWQAKESELLATISDDAWFGRSIGPHQHLQIARARALETGRPVLRATNTGITAVIDHRGKVVARLPQFVTDVLTGSVMPTRGLTPYVRFRDTPILILVFVLLIGAALRLRR